MLWIFAFLTTIPLKECVSLRSHDTLSLFLHDIMTCMHMSKKYNEIHGGRTNLTIRKHAKILTAPHKFRSKTLDSTDTVDFTHFRRTVNRYCEYCEHTVLIRFISDSRNVVGRVLFIV